MEGKTLEDFIKTEQSGKPISIYLEYFTYCGAYHVDFDKIRITQDNKYIECNAIMSDGYVLREYCEKDTEDLIQYAIRLSDIVKCKIIEFHTL